MEEPWVRRPPPSLPRLPCCSLADFCRALGSSLTDKCQAGKAACSQSAELLRGLYQPLASPLEYLDAEPPGSAGKWGVALTTIRGPTLATLVHFLAAGSSLIPTDVCLELLSLLVATSQASCYWVMSRAYRYLASWSLSPFLLVTQGDLQVCRTIYPCSTEHGPFSPVIFFFPANLICRIWGRGCVLSLSDSSAKSSQRMILWDTPSN